MTDVYWWIALIWSVKMSHVVVVTCAQEICLISMPKGEGIYVYIYIYTYIKHIMSAYVTGNVCYFWHFKNWPYLQFVPQCIYRCNIGYSHCNYRFFLKFPWHSFIQCIIVVVIVGLELNIYIMHAGTILYLKTSAHK